MNNHILLLLFILTPTFVFGINPSRKEPDDPHKRQQDVDGCNLSHSQLGSFMYSLAWGGIPGQPGLDTGRFIIRESQPSPAMFTSGVVYYQHPAAIKLVDLVNNGGAINVTIIGSDSLLVQFLVAAGQAGGAPIGENIGSNQRLMLVDTGGNPVTAKSGVIPAVLRVLFPEGAYVDIDTTTKLATRYRDTTGNVVVFADLPSSIALRLIYKDGALRQIRAAAGLADLVSRGVLGFEIRLYASGDEGAYSDTAGVYEPTGIPYRSVFFENTNAPAEIYDAIKITDTWGTQVKVDTFKYDTIVNDWTLSRGGDDQSAVQKESKTLVQGPGFGEFTYHIILRDNTQKIISKRDEIFKTFNWGKQKVAEIVEPDTLNLKTSYEYNEGSGKLESIIKPDGSWEAYEYDSAGRVTSRSTTWKDSAYSANLTTQRRIITYDYTSLDAADTLYAYNLPRTETESIITVDGAAPIVVGRTYHVYKIDGNGQSVIIEEKASSAANAYGSASNSRTTSVIYTGDPAKPGYNSAAAGRLYYEDMADGTRTTYTYTQDFANPSAAFVTSAVSATPSSPTGVDGLSTRTDTVYSIQGFKVRTQSYIFKNSTWYPTRNQVETVSSEGLTTARTLDGRQIYAAVYDGGRLSSETDESGVATSYTYDSLGKIESATRKGVPAAGSYAAQPDFKTEYKRSLGGLSCGCDGEVVTTVSSGGLSLTSTMRKDQIGRLVYEKDSAGLETNYIYTLGGRQVTRLNPDLGTVISPKLRDGRVLSETGTGTDARTLDYGVNADGTQWTQVSLGACKQVSTTDFLGRKLKTEQPAFSGGTLVSTQSYDAQGHLTRSGQSHIALVGGAETKLIADTLYYYDVMGNLTRTGLDSDGDNSLTPASADRITEIQTTFAQYESAWWAVQKTLVYPTLNSGTSVQVSETRQRLSGYVGTLSQDTVSVDLNGNLTRQSINIDPTTKLVTQTVTQPDSAIAATEVTYNGLLVAENSATVSAPTTYLYDALGRVVSSKDPRQAHAATTTYNPTTGQISSQKDAAGNPTNISYYPTGVVGAGRPSVIIDPSGQTQRLSYDLQGHLVYQWGTGSYPQSIAHNAFGATISSTTWRDIGAADLDSVSWPTLTGGDVTIWVYDAVSGLMTRKEYADGNGTDYTYDKANRLYTRTWSRSVAAARVKATYGYDPITGEMTSIVYSDGTPSVALTYDRLGRQATVSDAAGTRTFGYDSARLTLVTETLPATYFSSRVLTYDYQSTGTGLVPGRSAGYRLGTAAAPAQDFTATYGYDMQGRLASVTSGAGSFTYAYLLNSNRLASLTSPKVTTSYIYETDRDLRTQVANAVGATSISRFTYAVDVIGRRSNRVQDGTAFVTSTYDRFDYNGRRELTSSRNYMGTNPANFLSDTQSAALARLFDYDSIGNRFSSTEGTAAARTYTANALNQYTALTNPTAASTYNLDGGQTASGSGWLYDWDAENRLLSVHNYAVTPVAGSQKIDFEYDYQSRRIRRTLSTYTSGAWSVTDDRKFVYQGWNVVAELNATTNDLLMAYSWGLDLGQTVNGAGGVGGLLAVTTYSPTATHFFATYDANGNVSEYINSAGTIEAHFAYDPFGQTIVATGNNLSRFVYRFSTKYEEPQLGLYYYGFRYYNTQIGRWLSRDPIQERGGKNVYGMVWNDSISKIDFLGLDDAPTAPANGVADPIPHEEFLNRIGIERGEPLTPDERKLITNTGCIGLAQVESDIRPSDKAKFNKKGIPQSHPHSGYPENAPGVICFKGIGAQQDAYGVKCSDCQRKLVISVEGEWKNGDEPTDGKLDDNNVIDRKSYNYVTVINGKCAWLDQGIKGTKDKPSPGYISEKPRRYGSGQIWCTRCIPKSK